MVNVLPPSTGLGVITTSVITGALVSRVTVLEMTVSLPALSRAVITIVFVPSAKVNSLVKEPLLSTVTFAALPEFNLTVTVTGLDVASFVVPLNVTLGLFVINPAAGLAGDIAKVWSEIQTIITQFNNVIDVLNDYNEKLNKAVYYDESVG